MRELSDIILDQVPLMLPSTATVPEPRERMR